MSNNLGDSEFYKDIVTQTHDRSVRAFNIIKFLMSMKCEDNRRIFLNNEENYLKRFNLSSNEKRMVLERDFKAMNDYGVPMVAIGKIQGVLKSSMADLTLKIKGK